MISVSQDPNRNQSIIPSLWNDFIHVIQKHGLLKIISVFLVKIAGYIYYSLNIVVYKMELAERDVNWQKGDFTIREGNLADLESFVENSSSARRNIFYTDARERLNQGELLFVTVKDNEVVNFSWVKLIKRMDLPEIYSHYDLEKESWYIYHCYTKDKFRGQGIYTATLRYIADYVWEKGYTDLYGYCLEKNMAAHCGIGRTGSKPLVMMGITRILGFTSSRRFRKYSNWSSDNQFENTDTSKP